jgi:hypothetical protein
LSFKYDTCLLNTTLVFNTNNTQQKNLRGCTICNFILLSYFIPSVGVRGTLALIFMNSVVVVGYDAITDFSANDTKYILIEPRKAVVDRIRFSLPKNVELLVKVVSAGGTLEEKILYETTMCRCCRSMYSTDATYATTYKEHTVYKERVYTTSLKRLVRERQMTSFSIVWNLDLCEKEWAACLDELVVYECVLDSVTLNESLSHYNYVNSKLLTEFFTRTNPGMFMNTKTLNNIACPSIATVLTHPVTDNNKHDYELLCKHYNINEVGSSACLTSFASNKMYIYDKINTALDALLTATPPDNIVVILAPKVLSSGRFRIDYPLEQDTLYINRDLDVIYGSRNNMFLLKELITSESFVEHMDSIKHEKKEVMFRIFQKRHFYDYIGRIFNIKGV